MRKVEKFNWMSSTWETCEPMSIKELDMFRMFEPDGTPVQMKSGECNFIASSDSCIDLGVPGVQIF